MSPYLFVIQINHECDLMKIFLGKFSNDIIINRFVDLLIMRLKVGLYVQDISERFQICSASFSMYFSTWISLIHAELKFLNPFSSKDIIKRTTPKPFKAKYLSTRVIIDCAELFIQLSSSLINQSRIFSSYKHHTTVKFLVGISPSGVITFVSDAWPGKKLRPSVNRGMLIFLLITFLFVKCMEMYYM